MADARSRTSSDKFNLQGKLAEQKVFRAFEESIRINVLGCTMSCRANAPGSVGYSFSLIFRVVLPHRHRGECAERSTLITFSPPPFQILSLPGKACDTIKKHATAQSQESCSTGRVRRAVNDTAR